MTAYYIDGVNIARLNGVCLFLIFAGFVVALAMFIIPKKLICESTEVIHLSLVCL